MTMSPQDTWLDTWERHEERMYATLPYCLLAVSMILTVLVGGGSGMALLVDLALAGLAAAWMLWMVTLHPTRVERPRRMAFSFAVLVAMMAILVLRAPWFGFFAWSGYLFAFRVLKDRWRFVGLAAVVVVAATSQNGGLPQSTAGALFSYGMIILINALIVGGIFWFSGISYEQNQRRKQTLADLAEANSKLEIMLEENTGLHAQLLTQAREAGVLDERQRMAREIHDTLAQGFAGIIAQLEAAKQAYQHAAEWQGHIDQAQALARESLTEARRSVQALRPAPLVDARLPEALADMAQRWAKTSGVPLSFETAGEPRPMLAEVEVSLFRVAQEALTNVAKHAHASRVGVTLTYLEDEVLLDVRDDGVGFALGSGGDDIPSNTGHGFGLSTMRQRLRQVDGHLEIESAPGEGTSINARVSVIPSEGST